MVMPADVTSQTRNCFKTIEAALKDGGFSMADIVRATYYVTDAKDAEAVLAVCGERLGDIRPAATLLVVAGLLRPEMNDAPGGETMMSAPIPFWRSAESFMMPMERPTISRISVTSMAMATTLMADRKGRCTRLEKTILFISDDCNG